MVLICLSVGRKDFFMSKENLIVTTDIQITARELDFVTRFENNWEHLREILGIMRPIKKQPGAVLKSKYAENYRYFQRKINDFIMNSAPFFAFLPIRILNNCILLPIEAEDQNTALRIFSTLNDRGKPLSDADIFIPSQERSS